VKADKALRKAARKNADLIGSSHWFLVLFNDRMVEEVVPLIQMGLAVYLDKPVVLLVPRGAVVPMNLRRLALHIAEFDPADPTSMEAATRSLQQAMAH
jgi:hypothetical protein